MEYETLFYLFFICLLGLCVGSFLNVVICRIPNKESISFPGSHCPSCMKRLKAADLIPVISWIALRGRCRYCLKKISYRYPIVEIITSIFFLFAFINVITINNDYSLVTTLPSGLILISFLISLTFIDIEHMILPNRLTSMGSLLGIFLTSPNWLYLFLGWITFCGLGSAVILHRYVNDFLYTAHTKIFYFKKIINTIF